MSGCPLPAELWLGMSDPASPVIAWRDEIPVAVNITDNPRLRAWRVRIEVIEEVEAVVPEPYLQPKTQREPDPERTNR